MRKTLKMQLDGKQDFDVHIKLDNQFSLNEKQADDSKKMKTCMKYSEKLLNEKM